jgi:hypothetical protein
MSAATVILNCAQEGDLKAAGELLPPVYDELRRCGVFAEHDSASLADQLGVRTYRLFGRLAELVGADNAVDCQSGAIREN